MKWVSIGGLAVLGVLLVGCGQEAPEETLGHEAARLTAPTQVATFALLSSGRVTLGDRTTLSGGHLGVSPGTGDSVTEGSQAAIAVGKSTLGQRVVLKDNSHAGDLFTNSVAPGPGATYTSISPYTAPPAQPPIVAFTAGSNSLNVTTPTTIAAGNFGAVTVTSTLTLSGGTYQFQNLTLGTNAVVQASAAAIVRVAGKVSGTTANFVRIGPTGTQPAGNFRLIVAGPTDATGGVTLGTDARVTALVVSLASFSAADRFTGKGALAAKNVTFGNDSSMTFQTGFECNADTACNDGNACTTDACVDAKCTHPALPNGTACPDDANVCTSDACQAGVCAHPAVPNGTACTSDDNECTTDACSAGVCAHPSVPNGTACTDDLNVCTSDACSAGVCAHPALSNGTPCPDDGNVCTSDACNSGACAHPALADGTGCPEDGNGCTADACISGTCSHPSLEGAACPDDGNPCTADACASSACAHPPLPDGFPCTEDGNECTVDMCFSGSCGHPLFADGTPCLTDGLDCTSDVCMAGACSHPTAADGTACCINPVTCSDDKCQAGVCSPTFHTVSLTITPGVGTGPNLFTTPLDNPVITGDVQLDSPQIGTRVSDAWEYDRFELQMLTQCTTGDTWCHAVDIPTQAGALNMWPSQVGTFNPPQQMPVEAHGTSLGTGKSTVHLNKYNHSAELSDQGTVSVQLAPGTILVPVNVVIVEPAASIEPGERSYMKNVWENVPYYQGLFDDLWVPAISRFSHPAGKLEGLQGSWDFRAVHSVDGNTFTSFAPDLGEGFIRPDDVFAQCGIQFRLASVTTIDETDPRHVRFTSDGTFPGPPYCPGGSDFELRAIFDGWRQAAQTSPTQVLTGSFVSSAVTVAFSPFVANPDCVSGAKGLTNMSSHVSAIGVMQGEVNMNRFVLAHEIGHAVGMPGDINVSSSLCPNLMCAAAFNSHIPACEIRDGVVLSPPPYNCTPVAGEVSTPLASCDQARAVAKSIAMGAGIPLP